MKNMIFKRSKLGFTLVELLLVIAILAILVVLGVTGFVALRRNITIAKYDDLAREIYVAAQNQLTRLEANGFDQTTLGDLNNGTAIPVKPSDYAPDDWEDVKGFYRYAEKSNDRPMTVLLPLGAVADSVRTNGFYVIEYNVKTRTVYGVFYSQSDFEYSDVSGLSGFRSSRNVRKGHMVGYYGGSTVERDPLTHCKVPQLQIINENELRLNILNVPTDLTNVLVSVSDGVNTVSAVAAPVVGETGKRTVLFDSILEPDKHLWNLFPALIPGRDLTITVTYEKDHAISSSATVTANSLFDTREGNTATLAWARHLQNLEKTVSHLDDPDITIARQTAHIRWEEDFVPFVSINNENLKRFEGNNLEIRDLRGSNGLFARTKAEMELSGIRVVNPVINAVGTDPVGALVGTAAPGTSIHMCGVYANKLADDKTIAYNAYKDCYVDGKDATTGGLVGEATDITVTSSFAALPILKGGSGAALIGSASDCNISNSYANCDDLKPGFNYFVSGENNTVNHCYAAGNTASADKSDFCGADTVTDSYYAVSHRYFGETWADNQSFLTTEFRYIKETGDWKTIDQKQMSNAVKDEGWAEGTTWANMIAPLSHPYREYLNGRPFPYPAIKGLEHYGSWPDDDGTVNLKIDMILLNNESAGYAILAGHVVVKDLEGKVLFDSYDSKNADGSFNGKDTIPLSPETTVRIEITAEDGYEYLYTTIDGRQYYPTAVSTVVEYTVKKDTEADVTFRQKAFKLSGIPAVNKDGTYIGGSIYSLDLINPLKTVDITDYSQDETVETGSKVTVRPKVPGGYSGCVVWYVPAGQNENHAERIYLTPGEDDTYTFTMPAWDAEIHVMYTDLEAFFKIEYYLMDPSGNYPETPTDEADYKCGLGSQINQTMINALAESSGLPLTFDNERVRYLAYAVVNSRKNTDSNPVFESTLDENGTVTSGAIPHLTVESETSKEQPYLVKIYIDRKLYTVTLTADTHVDGVRFGNAGDFQRTVTREFRYGATVTAKASVAAGYSFSYWDPQDSRFMMSAETAYTFQVPQFDLNLRATAATDRYLVTINLLKNDESWLYSDPSREKDPITLTLVNSLDPAITYPMQVLTEPEISYAMQAVVPAISEYGAGYYVRVNYASGLQTQIYHSGTQESTHDEQLLVYVQDKPVERTARFYTVTYYPNKQNYAGTVPKGGTYPKYYQLAVEGNSGLLTNLTDEAKIFSGWKDYYADGTGSDTIYTGDEILTITKRTDMFAHWVTSLHVTYNENGADGGGLPVDAKTYQVGEPVTVKFGSLTRKGYRFLGWSTKQDATAATYTEYGLNTFQMSSVDVKLYAVWEREEYTVRFCDTDGNPLEGENYNYTGLYYGHLLFVPSLEVEGKPIIGWSLTKGGEIVCRPGEIYTVKGNTKLYARVTSSHITVTYMSGDGEKYATESFGIGIPGYLSYVPESGPVTAWRDDKGIMYLCDDSGRSEKVYVFMENTTLYAITGKVYNYNEQMWFDTLYAAVRDNATQNGDTLIVYRDTEEPYNIQLNKSLYIISYGDRTVKWKDGATVDSGDMHRLDDKDKEKGELTGCMNVYDNGNDVTVEFGNSDIPTLPMKGNTLTFDANRQSRVIALGSKATFHMYDGITLTNGKRERSGNPDESSNTAAESEEARSYYGGGLYAGLESVFYMHGGTISHCSAYKGGGVYLFADKGSSTRGSRMYMGDMVTPTAYSSTAIYYEKGTDEFYINAQNPVTTENYKQYFVTDGNPEICYNISTRKLTNQDRNSYYGWSNDDGGGGLLMLDLKDGDLVLYKGSIHSNTAYANGGGIVTDGGDTNKGDGTGNSAKLRIYEVDISHNTAYGYGGGIFQWQGIVYVYNSTLRQNHAEMNGGGIYLHHYGTENSDVEFHYGDISDNSADGDGGGVYVEGYPVTLTITHGNLTRNSAYWYGGGVFVVKTGSFVLNGGVVAHNVAGEDVGAEGKGGGVYSEGDITMTGGTVYNNRADKGGGIMYSYGKLILSGGSLYDNTVPTHATGSEAVRNDISMGYSWDVNCPTVITIPEGGIKLSGEKRVTVESETGVWSGHPFRFAAYEDPGNDYEAVDALYFTSGNAYLEIATHEDLKLSELQDYGLYLRSAEGSAKSSTVIFDLNYPKCENPDPKPYNVGTVQNINNIGPDTKREGFYLVGWARTPDAVEEQYTLFYDVVADKWRSVLKDGEWTEENDEPLYTIQDLSEQTLYAMWRPCVVVYEVDDTAKDHGVKIQSTGIGPSVTILNPSPMRYTIGDVTYDFTHWEDEKGNKYMPMQQVNLTENLRLTAKWKDRTANSCIIIFYFNDGTSDQTGELRREIVVNAGGSYDINVDIHQANKILVGWNTSKDGSGTTYATDGTIANLDHDLTLYAMWEDAVKLTYDVNGGDGNGTVISIAKGTAVEITENVPTREGCIFLGWSDSPDATVAKYFAGDTFGPIELNTTLYALWGNVVTFDLDGGEGEGFDTVRVIHGKSYTLPAAKPAKIGFTFAYWQDGTLEHNPGESVTVDRDITFKAIWHYTLTLHANGDNTKFNGTPGDKHTVGMQAGSVFNLADAVLTREGYILKGWSANAASKEPDYLPDYNFVFENNTELYAVWEKIQWTVSFDLDGGMGDKFGDVKVPYGEGYTLPTAKPAKDGYIFKGWQDGTLGYNPGDPVTVNGNITLKAIWNCTLTLHANGDNTKFNGTPGDEHTLDMQTGSVYNLADAVLTREGYILKGWSANAASKEPDYLPDYNFVFENNTELYAVWEKIQWTVSFDLDGGKGDVFGDVKVPYGEGYTLPTAKPAKDGYIFKGWQDGTLGYNPGDPVTVNGNITLKAIWNCTLTLHANGDNTKFNGTPGDEHTLDMQTGSVYNLADAVLTREGYILKGWSANAASKEPDYLPDYNFVFENNTELYAVWEKIQWTVSFDLTGGRDVNNVFGPVLVLPGGEFTIPEGLPEKGGVTFMYWETETGERVDSGETISVTGNMKLTAVWGYTVTFDLNGGNIGGATANLTKQVEAGTQFSLSESETPTQNGYIFMGWAEDKNADKATYSLGQPIPVEKDTTLYAVWGHNVTFNLNYDGAPESIVKAVAIGAEYSIDVSVSPREGYRLVGWSTKSDTQTYQVREIIKLGEKYGTVNQDTTLYAVWAAISNEKHTVTVKVYPFLLGGQKTTVDLGDDFTLPEAPTWQGFDKREFVGWNVYYETDQSTILVTLSPGDIIAVQFNIIIVGSWEPGW